MSSEIGLPSRFRLSAFLVQISAAVCLNAPAFSSESNTEIPVEIDRAIAKIALELKQSCPLSDPGNQAAFDQCRQVLFEDSSIKKMMSSPVLWGRQRDTTTTLKDSSLTQFAPDVVSGLYLSLFMFDGKYKVTYNDSEKRYFATLGAAFRNRLKPGQFPYPFWHDEKKWDAYENANNLMLWIDPANNKIRVIQFSARGEAVPGYPASHTIPPTFDGKWLWTDEHGETQPAVTLFDGLFHADNPFKKKLDASYRDLAITLRESQCFSCHVPNNPDKMKRLVLLQSPAHAAMEIHRVLKSVREKKMPLDDFGLEKPLDPKLEAMLLEKGGAFEKLIDASREWERQQKPRTN